MGPIWNKAKIIIKCPVYFRGICKIRRAPRSCKGLYNLQKIFNNPRGGCGDFEGDATWKNEDKEEYRCETCHRKISKEEYEEFNGLCRWCRGAPTQKGFPSPPGFPKPF